MTGDICRQYVLPEKRQIVLKKNGIYLNNVIDMVFNIL